MNLSISNPHVQRNIIPMKYLKILASLTLFMSMLLACTLPGFGPQSAVVVDETAFTVTVTQPITGQKFELGQAATVQSEAVAPNGIVRTELLINGQVIWVDANANPQPNAPFIVAQPWTPDTPGSYAITVRAYNENNVSAESAPILVEVMPLAAAAVDEPAPTSTPVPPPTATPVSILVDAPTATPYPPTPSPTPDLSTPTATPTPGLFLPTDLEPDGRFQDIWQELGAGKSRLGYPTAPKIIDRNYARQYFERGLMFWWDNPDSPDYIWALDTPAADLKSGVNWHRYADAWDGDQEFSCVAAEANGGVGPVRGFGYLWCSQPILQARLGNPRGFEAGSSENPPYSQVQFFQGGVMLTNPLDAEIYVLFAQGDWLRFAD
jgi:hypothetical protein